MRKQVKAFTFYTFSTEFFANFVHKPNETSGDFHSLNIDVHIDFHFVIL